MRQRYGEEIEGIGRLTKHADKMHYPQFREKLLQIATDKRRHAEWIAEKIITLGGRLPAVAERRSTDGSSWQHLLKDLEEESRSADRLQEQIWRIKSDHPEIGELLQQIFEKNKKHRREIKDMLMRSDAFALSLA
ncbi:MAG: ferritin-like domain-containing protein [Candidatus Binatia bacterium]